MTAASECYLDFSSSGSGPAGLDGQSRLDAMQRSRNEPAPQVATAGAADGREFGAPTIYVGGEKFRDADRPGLMENLVK